MKGIVVGIDASNLRAGGGLVHLKGLVAQFRSGMSDVAKLIVWCDSKTAAALPENKDVDIVMQPELAKGYPYRVLWRWLKLPKLVRAGVDLVFSPGGVVAFCGKQVSTVTMCQNMLPFEWRELFRYRLSITTLRLLVLRVLQARSFRRANGLIFISNYARQAVSSLIHRQGKETVIAHGVNPAFVAEPRPQRSYDSCSKESPFKILYVSIIDLYKFQWTVLEGVAKVSELRPSIKLDLIGKNCPPAMKKVMAVKSKVDVDGKLCEIHETMSHDELTRYYHDADLFVFASSVENLPNILIEAMASGLPILCSNRGVMPEVLGDAGVYFDPESPNDLSEQLLPLIDDVERRQVLAQKAYEQGKAYSWQKCARETFQFLREVYDDRQVV